MCIVLIVIQIYWYIPKKYIYENISLAREFYTQLTSPTYSSMEFSDKEARRTMTEVEF